MLAFKLALVGLPALVDASVCRSTRCAGALGVPEACRLGLALLGLVGAAVRRPRRLFDASCAATLSVRWSDLSEL